MTAVSAANPDEFAPSTPFQGLVHAAWLEASRAAPGGVVPYRAWDVLNVWRCVPWAFLIAVEYAPDGSCADFRYLVLGEEVKQRSVRSYPRGQSMMEIPWQAKPSSIWSLMETAVTTRKPASIKVEPLRKPSDSDWVEQCAFPLAGPDGRTITHLFGLIEFMSAARRPYPPQANQY